LINVSQLEVLVNGRNTDNYLLLQIVAGKHMSNANKKTPADKPSRIQIRNRQKILDAALDVFSRYGYRGSTVAQIAERAEMSKANLLYYYKSKNDIYVKVLENTLSAWLAPLIDLKADGDPFEQIWAYTQSKLQLSIEQPEASRLFANEILQGAPMIKDFLQTDLKQLVDKKCDVIQQWIDTGRIAPVCPLNLLFLIWAATQHYADFSAQTEILSDDSTTLHSNAEHTLKTIIINGLVPR
jgi:TetR/AcrR family transcriptional regulator